MDENFQDHPKIKNPLRASIDWILGGFPVSVIRYTMKWLLLLYLAKIKTSLIVPFLFLFTGVNVINQKTIRKNVYLYNSKEKYNISKTIEQGWSIYSDFRPDEKIL